MLQKTTLLVFKNQPCPYFNSFTTIFSTPYFNYFFQLFYEHINLKKRSNQHFLLSNNVHQSNLCTPQTPIASLIHTYYSITHPLIRHSSHTNYRKISFLLQYKSSVFLSCNPLLSSDSPVSLCLLGTAALIINIPRGFKRKKKCQRSRLT